MPVESQNLLRAVEEFAKQVQSGSTEPIASTALRELVDGFDSGPILARRVIRGMLRTSQPDFTAAALRILHPNRSCAGQDYLIGLILEQDLLVSLLAASSLLPLDAAIGWARHLYLLDPQLDTKLLRLIIREDDSTNDLDRSMVDRIFEIVSAISDSTRLMPTFVKLLRHKDAHVRSKVALMMSRVNRNADWLQTQMNNPDPRVRANALEGLLESTPSELELHVVRKALADSHHRVISTALLVLHKNGRTDAAELLREMAHHFDEFFRTAAAWAMGQTEDISFLDTVQKMARSDTGNAKRMAFKSSVLLRKDMLAKAQEELTARAQVAVKIGSNGTL